MSGRFRGYLERLLGSRQREAASVIACDSELLRRFAQTGDQEAFEIIVWRHGVMVLGVCQRLIHDEHLAEDAFQAVFLVLARQAKGIRSLNVAGWLYRVARRVAAKVVHGRIPMHELHSVAAKEPVSPIEREELSQLLDAEIARLPERLRQPVLLCYLGGRSVEEASRELGCPRGTILSRLASARKRLIARLGRRGVALPAVLPVIGIELNGRIVSATVAAALQFVAGRSPVNSASLLAQGVIQTMTHNKLLFVLGAMILTMGFIGGIGWVAARSDTGELPVGDTLTEKGRDPAKVTSKDEAERKGLTDSAFVNAQQPDFDEQTLRQIQKDFEQFKIDPVLANAMEPDPKDSQLRKLQKKLCQSLGICLEKYHTLILIGKWNPLDFSEVIKVTVSLSESFLEIVDKPEDKLKCYELRVTFLAGFYAFTDTRVQVGTDPSQNRDIAKAAYLESQIKLLKFKMELEKTKK